MRASIATTVVRALRGAVLGLLVACAAGALIGSSRAMGTMRTREPGARAEVYAVAISEGLNCAALLALLAVPLGAWSATRRRP